MTVFRREVFDTDRRLRRDAVDERGLRLLAARGPVRLRLPPQPAAARALPRPRRQPVARSLAHDPAASSTPSPRRGRSAPPGTAVRQRPRRPGGPLGDGAAARSRARMRSSAATTPRRRPACRCRARPRRRRAGRRHRLAGAARAAGGRPGLPRARLDAPPGCGRAVLPAIPADPTRPRHDPGARGGTAVRALTHAWTTPPGRLRGRRGVLVDVRTPMNLAVLRPVLGAAARRPARGRAVHRQADTAIASGAADAAVETRRSRARPPLDPRRPGDERRPLEPDAAAPLPPPHQLLPRRCRQVRPRRSRPAPRRRPRTASIGWRSSTATAWIATSRPASIRPEQAVLVGFPKSDELLNGVWHAADVRASLGLPAANRDRCSTRRRSRPPTRCTSPARRSSQALLDAGLNVIVKLHDRSMVPHARYTNGIDWPARLARVRSGIRSLRWRVSPTPVRVCPAADVLVTDHSTVGFEFALLDRPIVVFDAPRLPRRRSHRRRQVGAAAVDGGRRVTSPLTRMTRGGAAGSAAPARLQRRRSRPTTLFAHAGHATERALAVVYELLEMAPAAADVRFERAHPPWQRSIDAASRQRRLVQGCLLGHVDGRSAAYVLPTMVFAPRAPTGGAS